jgi:hypothetical protein
MPGRLTGVTAIAAAIAFGGAAAARALTQDADPAPTTRAAVEETAAPAKASLPPLEIGEAESLPALQVPSPAPRIVPAQAPVPAPTAPPVASTPVPPAPTAAPAPPPPPPPTPAPAPAPRQPADQGESFDDSGGAGESFDSTGSP